MSIFRISIIAFSLTLLIACGGGGGSTASTGSPAGTGSAPTGNDRVSHPPETKSLGSRVVTIGGDDGVAPLSGLTSFTPSVLSPTMREIRKRHQPATKRETRGVIDPNTGKPHFIWVPGSRAHFSSFGKIGSYQQRVGINCGSGVDCITNLPGDSNHKDPREIFDNSIERFGLFSMRDTIADLSLVYPNAYYRVFTKRDSNNCGQGGRHSCNDAEHIRVKYFTENFISRISSTATIGDVSFARGSLTATRQHDKAPLEFQTFAGWLDSGIFGTIRVKVGESGSEQHLFTSYYTWDWDEGTRPSGTGSATWEGAAVASIKDVAAIIDGWSFIRGDATIDIDDLANPDVDLRFDNWKTIDGREVSLPATTFENISLRFDGRGFELRGGETTGRAEGWFHGENANKVSGHFQDDTLAGAFGAVRQ